MKKLVYIFSVILFISVIVCITLFTAYSKKIKDGANKELSRLNKESKILDNEELDKLEETSYSADSSVSNTIFNTNKSKKNDESENNSENKIDKTSKLSKDKIGEVVSDFNDNSNDNVNNNVNNNVKMSNVDVSNISNNVNTTINSSTEDNETNSTSSNTIVNEDIAEKEVLNFIAPVSGEIIKDFSIDTLVYSNTLKEWTTHSGIDIKADKTSIVVASESGVVESIKNDPRFGLTITIVHDNGFKTIYSNLLTTEFVKENEKVEKGQTIATIGESASFEVADEPHLHFEIYKDGEVVNPTVYLKDI